MRLTIILCLALMVLTPVAVYADETECENFISIQNVLLSEGASQPLETKIEMARVVVTKGACYREANFYTGYGVALANIHRCANNWHCRAYYLIDTIAPDVRESAALAAHIALTEQPRVARYHFDANRAPLAAWWDSPKACPNVYGYYFGGQPRRWFISGELRIC